MTADADATTDPHPLKARLGAVGVWTTWLFAPDRAEAHRAAAEIDGLGYGAAWLGGASHGGDNLFDTLAGFLAATPRLTIATGIASIWTRSAADMAAAASRLEADFPDRFVLGLGASHAPLVEALGIEYRQPYSTMAAYLEGMDAAGETPQPARVLAALRPKMLELAATRAAGAHPYLVTPDHSARARELLGPEPLLAPEQAVVLATDPSQARAVARTYVAGYLQLPNYVRNLRWLGFSDDDLSGDGSDRLVDALVAWGDVDAIAARIREHLAAGADHVAVQPVVSQGLAVEELRELAPALLG